MPLWDVVRGRTGNVPVEMGDLIPFMKVMSCLMFYKCSIKNFYEDPTRMYKRHMGSKMSDGISDRKFRAILSAFRR